MNFKKIMMEYSMGIDDLDYSDYGKIIANLSVGNTVRLNKNYDNKIGKIIDLKKRNFADVDTGNEIISVHLSEIEKILK